MEATLIMLCQYEILEIARTGQISPFKRTYSLKELLSAKIAEKNCKSHFFSAIFSPLFSQPAAEIFIPNKGIAPTVI